MNRPVVRSFLTSFAVSALLLTGCSYMVIEPIPEGPADMHGEITQVKTEGLGAQQALAEILIEEDPTVPLDEWLDSPEGYTKVRWVITPLTELYRQDAGGSLVRIGVEELTVGSEVHAWNTGFYVDTGLPIAYAAKIVVVFPAP